MNYGLDVNYQLPDIVNWANVQQNRIDQRAKERNDAYRNLMQMLGRGVGAYQARKDYKDWKADQEMWDNEDALMDMVGMGYYDPNDIDIDAQLSLNPEGYIASKRDANPYWIPGNDDATQKDYVLYKLGLI